jgi:hypothetical protein
MSKQSLFTTQRRANLLESLAAFFRADHMIAGVILVGPSAEDRQDDFSGIYAQIVVDPEADFPMVYRRWKDLLPTMMTTIACVESAEPGRHATISLLLEGYLEVVLYFVRFHQLIAPSRHVKMPDGSMIAIPAVRFAPYPWKVYYAKKSVRDELEQLEDERYHANITQIDVTYQEIMRQIWQPVLRAVMALRRNEMWVAVCNIEQIRAEIIRIAGINYDVDVRNNANIDQLPEMLLISLRHTIPTGFTLVAIRRALLSALDLLLVEANILEDQTTIKGEAQRLRQILMPYVEGFA